MKNPVRLVSFAAIFCICISFSEPVAGQVPQAYGSYGPAPQSQPMMPFEVHGMPPSMPAGYGLPGPHMGGYPMPTGAGRLGGGYQSPPIDHYVRNPQSQWDAGGPVEGFLTQLFTRSRLRFEYLHWEMDAPGDFRLGAPLTVSRSPVLGGNDTSVPFEIFDSNTGATLGQAIVPTLGAMTLDSASGVRGNLAIPFRGGSLEVNVWGLGQVSDTIGFAGLSDRRITDPVDPTVSGLGTIAVPNIVIPFLTNGVVSDSAGALSRVYDDSFSADISSQMWGAEFNVFSDYAVPGEGFKFEPLYGFRYIGYQESFDMVGTNTDGAGSAAVTVETDRINSRVTNNLYGPQLGFRTALVHRWFVLEAIPRVTFALNNYSSHLDSSLEDLDTDGVIGTNSSSSEERDVDYSTIFQVSLNARAHLTPRFSLFGGYDFLWIHRLSRPHNNIRYDSTTDDLGIAITSPSLALDGESMFTHGLSVGGEFVF